jgi:hypothetical protein
MKLHLNMLHGMIDHCAKIKRYLSHNEQLTRYITRKRMNREFRLNAQIGDYDMDNIILDLGI